MNSLSFTIQGKPVSTNDYKASRVVKGKKAYSQMYETKKAKDYKNWIRQSLLSKKADIFKFETNFSIYEHGLACCVVVWLPDLITQKRTINRRSIDIDNCLKCLIDGIFAQFDKLDDKMICDLFVQKRKAEEFSVDFTLHKVDLSSIIESPSVD